MTLDTFSAICHSTGVSAGPVSVPQDCGVPSKKHPPSLRFENGKVVGVAQGIAHGMEATPHSYPWTVLVNGCGGAIIGDRWVLTAAHCVTNDDGKMVSTHVGNSYVALHNKNTDAGRKYDAENVFVHDDYTSETCKNGKDVALIKLKEKIEFNDEVRPICLPSESDNFRNQEGLKLVAAGNSDFLTLLNKSLKKISVENPRQGWGFQHPNQTYTPKLQQAVYTVNKKECVRSYKDEKLERICVLGDKMGQGICKGDSGSSLMYYKDGKFYTAGTANCGTAGEGSCDPTIYHPSMYMHLPDFMQWVKNTMKQ